MCDSSCDTSLTSLAAREVGDNANSLSLFSSFVLHIVYLCSIALIVAILILDALNTVYLKFIYVERSRSVCIQSMHVKTFEPAYIVDHFPQAL